MITSLPTIYDPSYLQPFFPFVLATKVVACIYAVFLADSRPVLPLALSAPLVRNLCDIKSS
jgi:hypothetical protein